MEDEIVYATKEIVFNKAVGNVAAGTYRIFVYDGKQYDCEQAWALFLSLSDEQKVLQTRPQKPVLRDGETEYDRACSGNGLEIEGNPGDFTGVVVIPGGGSDTGAGSGQPETEVAIYSSASNPGAAFRASTLADGKGLLYRINPDGTRVEVNQLPGDAVRANLGIRNLNAYALEPKATFNSAQFGKNKYFSSRYGFSHDFNVNQDNVATRKGQGYSWFSRFVLPSNTEYEALPQRQKIYYQFEGELHGYLEGALYWERTLAEVENRYSSVIASGNYIWTANIETSIEWHDWMYKTGFRGYDSWETARSRMFALESVPNTTMSLEQFFGSGLVEQEMQVRRANRNAIMMSIARARNSYAAYGSSMMQGEPRTDSLSNLATFVPGTADVSNIGGSNGTITLNGRTYTGINKNVYGYENVMLDYYYYFDATINSSDYDDIWVRKLPGTQNLPYIWSKLYPYHIVASEKGHWQANKYKMRNIPGQIDRATIRMQEPFFEGKFYTPDHSERSAFMPFDEVQNIKLPDGYSYTPKVWLPPYMIYGAYVVHRFLEGDDFEASGYHHFNAPGLVKLEPNDPVYNHDLHTMTALKQARDDMQPYERFFPGSTLVIDPEVQINQTGNWSAYSGADAFGFLPDGGRVAQKPAYIPRFKPTNSGWQVVMVCGMGQDWTGERIDLVRFPGGALNGAMFRIKLRGPGAHIYEFAVSSATSNQICEATPQYSPTWEKPGYSGRISQ